MNTLKKFVAIIIIITLILFFVNVYNTVTKSQEDFNVVQKAAKNVRDYIEDTFNIEGNGGDAVIDDGELCSDNNQDSSSNTDIWYDYKDKVDLSEYVLKTEAPMMPDMNKYILKTKVAAGGKSSGDTNENEERGENEERDESDGDRVRNTGMGGGSSGNSTTIIKNYYNQKTGKKRVVKRKRVGKKTKAPVKSKKTKQTVKKPVKKTEKPAPKKIASDLDKAVEAPKKIVPDAETKRKIENDPNRDLIDKNNVTKYGKDTKNGNPIVFQFDKILPDNLTYKNPNKCIHSNVEGTDNSNVVDDDKNMFEKLTDWFKNLKLFKARN